MIEPQKKTVWAMIILVMLGASPISITYSFADFRENQGLKSEENGLKNSKSNQKGGIGVILTEKIVDGKLKVQRYALPDNITEKDIFRILSVGKENPSSWAYVNYKSYNSGIVLFDGIASKIGENHWKVSSIEIKNPEGRISNAELDEETGNSNTIKENAVKNGVFYKVIYSGKTIENDVTVFFIKSSLKGLEIGQNMNIYTF